MTNSYTDEGITDLYDFFLNAPIGLHILDYNYVIQMANEADLRMAGYSGDPGAYIGRRITEFHADPAKADEMLDHWASGRPLVNFRTRLRRRDGSEQPVVIHSNSRFKEGHFLSTRYFAFPDLTAPGCDALGQARSVTDLMESMAESERRELFDLLDDFFENAPVALHIVGPDGLIRRANRMELESLGYRDEPEEYLGHHIAEFHADQAVIDEMLERLVNGRPLVHYQATLLCRGGGTMPVVIYSSPRFNDGQFVNTRCFTFPKTIDGIPETRSFAWPRNDTDTKPTNADALTVALKRLAGRKSAEESLGFLAETSKVLASNHYLVAVPMLCGLIAPFLADWCLIELGVGEARRTLGTARGYNVAGSDELVRMVATGDRQIESERHALRIPIAAGDDTSGALLMVRQTEREPFGAADIALAEEVARRVSVALEVGRFREQLTIRP